MRLDEANILLDARHWSGAYYLSGYAIELALKAVIARQFRAGDIPDRNKVNAIWTHKLDNLLDLAELRPDLELRAKASPKFAANWNMAKGWSEGSRYETIDETMARAMLHALSDPLEGAFGWIRSKW